MVYSKRNKLIQGFRTVDHPLYNTYNGMKERCSNPKLKSYVNYGGRGLTVCARWLESFENFALDMGLKDSPLLTLERIDNEKGYSPENCIWAGRLQQGRNKRTYKTNAVGHSGITITSSGGFMVRLQNTRVCLGVFPTLKEAVIAQKNGVKNEAPRLNNTTGHRGINIHTNGSFMVRKLINNERVYLGNTDTIESAIELYDIGEKQDKKGGFRDEKGRYSSTN